MADPNNGALHEHRAVEVADQNAPAVVYYDPEIGGYGRLLGKLVLHRV